MCETAYERTGEYIDSVVFVVIRNITIVSTTVCSRAVLVRKGTIRKREYDGDARDKIATENTVARDSRRREGRSTMSRVAVGETQLDFRNEKRADA